VKLTAPRIPVTALGSDLLRWIFDPHRLGILLAKVTVAACSYMSIQASSVPIPHPVGLMGVAFLLVLSMRASARAYPLLYLLTFYLVCLLVNQVNLKQGEWFLGETRITFSYGVPVLLMFLISFWLRRSGSGSVASRPVDPFIMHGWEIGIGIILLHMAFVFLLLKRFYGYGFETDIRTLGSLFFIFLIYSLNRDLLNNSLFRGLVGFCSGLYCLMHWVRN